MRTPNANELLLQTENLQKRLLTELILTHQVFGDCPRYNHVSKLMNDCERRIARRRRAAILEVINAATREDRIEHLGAWYGQSLEDYPRPTT